MAAEPLTDDERQAIRDLHAQGHGCNEIARRIDRNPATVSRAAARLGLSFDRAETMAATQARRADAAAQRSKLMLEYLADARRLREQLWMEHEYIDHGGKEYVEVRWTQDEPSPTDKLKLMQASTLASDKSLKLDLHDGQRDGLPAVDAWLDAMAGADEDAEDAAP